MGQTAMGLNSMPFDNILISSFNHKYIWFYNTIFHFKGKVINLSAQDSPCAWGWDSGYQADLQNSCM